MTTGEARRLAAEKLLKAGVADAALDAMLLLEWSSGQSRSHIIAYPQEELDAASESRFLEAVGRRVWREPLQYITGEQEFMGLTFRVDENVLIPRQDTEILVEEALSFIRPGMDVLDLCTGSGCIILSIIAKCGGAHRERNASQDFWDVRGTGSDVSAEALRVAEENGRRLGITADFIKSDLFDDLEGRFDLIVSNPPYIRSADIHELMEEVRDYEPVIALDGHSDGLWFYKRIVSVAPDYLKKGGRLLLEVGYDQAGSVRRILERAGFTDIKTVRDLSGHERVVEGSYV